MERKLIVLSIIILTLLPLYSKDNKKDKNEANKSYVTDFKSDKTDKKVLKLEEEKNKLKAEYDLIIQKEKNKIAELEAEYNKLVLENNYFNAETQKKLSEIKRQLDEISLKNKLMDEKLKSSLSLTNEKLERLVMENKLRAEENKKVLSDIEFKLKKLSMENDLIKEEQERIMLKYKLEEAKMDFEERKIKHEQFLKNAEVEELKIKIALREKKDEYKRAVDKNIKYTDNIYENGVLKITDRRIPLNGVITMATADYIVNRINYFNNISTAPIFIVIDRSPGGSVMAGYKILKAMEASQSPVYVVVKSYAASMAATITTLAKKSFVYPNAIILHHQMSTMAWGNMTQLKEKLEMARKWEKRLMGPVAKKLGMTIEEFRKEMYKHNSDGDWEEFGDMAVKLKWADTIVDNIIEEGLVKDPDYYNDKRFIVSMEEKIDKDGKKYVELPRLDPFDFYFIYNPDNYYRYNY